MRCAAASYTAIEATVEARAPRQWPSCAPMHGMRSNHWFVPALSYFQRHMCSQSLAWTPPLTATAPPSASIVSHRTASLLHAEAAVGGTVRLAQARAGTESEGEHGQAEKSRSLIGLSSMR